MGGIAKVFSNPPKVNASISSGGMVQQTAAAASPQPASAPGVTQATQVQEQEGSRLRGARRRGRQLLSDARLNAESGIQTLGSDQTLG